MKKFIQKLLLFLSIPVFCVFCLDMFHRNQNSLHKEKYAGAIQKKDSIEVVVLGNSHANYGVDPKGFDLYAYNLANVDQSLYFDKRITLSLMPQLEKLKYVLISVDYHSLYFSSQGIRDKWSYFAHGIKYKNTNYFLANISPSLFGYTPKVSMSFIKKRLLNVMRYGADVIDFDVENGVNLKDSIVKGFITYEGVDESSHTVKEYKARARGFKKRIVNSDERNAILEDLDGFIKTLLAHKITPILFTTPTFSGYNQYLETAVIDQNSKDVKAICEKHKIEYWDFMKFKKYKKDNFYNGDHLNKESAYDFGRILNDSIRKIESEKGNRALSGTPSN